MNKLLLSAAISAAFFAGQAQATTLTLHGTSPDLVTALSGTVDEIWISGSSAATPFIEKSVVADCSGTAYKYLNGSNDTTWVCNSSLATGTVNIVHKREGGGSVTGVYSALGTTLPTYATTATLDAANCAAAVNGVSSCATTGTIVSTAHAGDINLADVDAAQFESVLNGGVVGASALKNTAVATQIFGIAVNLRLRNALQVAEVAAGSLPAGCTVSPANETEACVPSLTTPQISAIFGKGRLTDWNNLRYDNTAVTQTLSDTLFGAQATADKPGNRDIHICSRTAGSGTLATLNINFENAPCFSGNEAIQAAGSQTISSTETTTQGAVKVYHSMSGSGDLENCLEGLNQGSTKGSFTYPAIKPTTGNTFRWAIGVLSLDRNATNAKNYRFIKIDGFSPSAINVVNGKYKFWSELVAVNNGTLSTDPLAVDLLANLGNANQIAALNVTNANFGLTGFLGTASNANYQPTSGTAISPGTLINAAFDAARPVNPWTHEAAAGGGLNHCRVPSIPTGAKVMPSLN